VPKDGGADGGTSDPYVKVTCMDKHARTKTIEKELNPIWDQWVVLESVRSASDFPLHFGQLLVTLYDEDVFTGDDEIGSFEIDLAEVWKREGHCVRTLRALRFSDRARLRTCRPSHRHWLVCRSVGPGCPWATADQMWMTAMTRTATERITNLSSQERSGSACTSSRRSGQSSSSCLWKRTSMARLLSM
jgi:hypothetical protein